PLPFADAGAEPAWAHGPMRRMKEQFEDAGLELAVIESSPPMQKIRLGQPGWEAETEAFNIMLQSMGALGIPVVCYNFMAVYGWRRPAVNLPGRGGALVTGYDHTVMEAGPLPPESPVSETQLWENFHRFLEQTLPVAESAGVKLALHPDDPP